MSYACQSSLGFSESTRPRTLVVENEDSSQLTIFEIEVVLGEENDLSSKIEAFCPLSHHSVSIYHPDFNKFVPLPLKQNSISAIIPWTYLEPQVVMLRYKILPANPLSTPKEDATDMKEPTDSTFKERSK